MTDLAATDAEAGAGYMVVAYRNRRAYVLDHGDYAERAATREEAERARRRLTEQNQRNRLGWQYIDIRPAARPDPGSSQ